MYFFQSRHTLQRSELSEILGIQMSRPFDPKSTDRSWSYGSVLEKDLAGVGVLKLADPFLKGTMDMKYVPGPCYGAYDIQLTYAGASWMMSGNTTNYDNTFNGTDYATATHDDCGYLDGAPFPVPQTPHRNQGKTQHRQFNFRFECTYYS
ncbi:uncharacterized protein BDZ99DRAFT_499176 [Mytilinidion resinicola]|uniref:Uncharacterized protein n=1 Tax=Mytilinidion resinicola TaxID=574789 RepID=A0A6A6YIT2_9PEZI|nr:uncharacterized protein BDZ99DRAFT_499176 [Mytilinidion resinicola]KAF2808766.1 hypothetical protein BDZ99DRAFT_499176 [Mytilinidion resinicola]